MRYEKATEGIRVQVQPRFSLADSDPADGTFVFSYSVNMSNEGDSATAAASTNLRSAFRS